MQGKSNYLYDEQSENIMPREYPASTHTQSVPSFSATTN